MASTINLLRLLADPTRLRLLLLFEQEELSVAELQEILRHGAVAHFQSSRSIETGRAWWRIGARARMFTTA